MVASVKDMHCCEIGGRQYWFRAPTSHDLPKMRRSLTRQGLRRPHQTEFRVAAQAGLTALAELAGDPAEGERQKALLTEWYRLLEPTKEDDIDEPDFEARAAELAHLEAERIAAMAPLLADAAAIEANLARHWPPYCELLADHAYWEEVSNIELVKLLLVRIDDGDLQVGADGMLSDATFQMLPRADRAALASFATRLLVPAETQRKN